MKTVVDYLSTVLGIEQYLSPQEKEPKVIFLFEEEMSSNASGLFLRMTEAMKLKPHQYRIVVGELPDDVVAEYLVSFLPQGRGPVLNLSFPTLQTEGPEFLLENPGHKKKVWLDLQKVMKHISVED